MASHEYTWIQQFTNNWAGWPTWLIPEWARWSPPRADYPYDIRHLDRTTVADSTSIPWPDSLAAQPLVMPATPGVWLNSSPGLPIQRSGPVHEPYTEINPWAGNSVRNITLPFPDDPRGRWIEGHPGIGGGWDRHSILIDPSTGVTHEAIGTDTLRRTVLASGVWLNGKLVSGTPVTHSGLALHPYLLDRFDEPHRLALGLTDYGPRLDGTPSDGSGNNWAFPRPGQVVRLSLAAYHRILSFNLPIECQVVAAMLHTHGAVIHDRTTGINALAQVAGTQWTGTTLPLLTDHLVLADLELVTSDN